VSLLPPRWTLDQFTDGVTRAIEVFRIERLNEAREDYTSHFDEARAAVEDLLELSTGLTTLDRAGRAALADAGYLEALRYIAAPPVSFDDLETLSGVAGRDFEADGKWQTVIATVLALVDTRRFGWLADGREPTEAERNGAIVATAAQIASRRIMTARANEAKAAQEDLVRTALTGYGYTEVTARVINTLRDAPSPSEFCGESMLGSRKADFVIGLWDDRILAVADYLT
jgi:XamI restriction endonuclease